MKTPSAESARALTQAVLFARLCDRYHDLASYASEPVKQRIHFLAKSDGSNLKELFIWDLAPFNSLLSTSTGGIEPATVWKPEQIEDYILQHWSADQLPLDPPNNVNSWESTTVYYKSLDPETVQAIVPIGQPDGVAIIAVVLLLEAGETLEDGPCWKYHNMAVLGLGDLQTNGWSILTDQLLHKNEKVSGGNNNNNDDDDDSDDDDSDGDYWGQYGEEDESPSDENSSQNKPPKVSFDTANDTAHEDDDEDYWKRYAEQQEKQEEIERKRNFQQQQQQQQQQLLHDIEPQDLVSGMAPQNSDLQKVLASLPSIGSSAGISTSSTNPLGQVDQTQMLSSLLQMLASEDVAQQSTSLGSGSGSGQEILDSQASVQTQVKNKSMSLDQKSNNTTTPMVSTTTSLANDDSIIDLLRSTVLQATRAGYSKDEVFEMLGSIYESLE
ncbi:hypothetical protein BGZ80_000255 [Entomortierella chlamydospora]|uniref:Uncharacterized protein n=1 Tax=Entomortierella chlamydospora TaxID=101097 RepID=A0A9P6MSF3_9FUNG|nr:hypothetical protein BGZ79_009557 [Entomortierella chlamydospora]KAG0012021.1 hypothetical protein BGZ80_000255 [Entomortierella chlamydospora]